MLTQRDHSDHSVVEFSNEIQLTHFGENSSISMEGVAVCFLEGGDIMNEKFHCHSCTTDDKRQDSRTAHVNMSPLIENLQQESQLLLGHNSVELMDGCAKQHRCDNALCLMSIVSAKKKIVVDRMISALHHGKGDCDSQGGIDKNHLRQHLGLVATPELHERKCQMRPHAVESGKKRSMADTLAKILSDPPRQSGMKDHSEHAKREVEATVSLRKHHVVHHGNDDTAATSPLPIVDATLKVTNGFKTKKNEQHNGTHCRTLSLLQLL